MGLAESLRARGVVDDVRAARLEALESRRLFSFHRELRALFYLGVLLIVAGVGATVKGHLERVGPLGVAALLAAAIAACAAYCARRAPPWSAERVQPATPAFDYVLYLACALLGVELAFVEAQFHLFGPLWRAHFLWTGLLFLGLAYRGDNRLVLAAGLLDLAAWLELSLHAVDGGFTGLRLRLLVYAAALLAAGRGTALAGVKAHFEETFLTLSVHAVAWALLPGVFDRGLAAPEVLGLAALSGACAYYAYLRRRFAFLLYGCAYGYLGLAACAVRLFSGWREAAWFFLLSACGLAFGLLRARRAFELKVDA